MISTALSKVTFSKAEWVWPSPMESSSVAIPSSCRKVKWVCTIMNASKRRDLSEGKNCDEAERETPGCTPIRMVSDKAQLNYASFVSRVARCCWAWYIINIYRNRNEQNICPGTDEEGFIRLKPWRLIRGETRPSRASRQHVVPREEATFCSVRRRMRTTQGDYS